MGRPRLLNAGSIDSIAEEPHPPRGADGGGDPAALACAISAEASAVLAVMRRSLRHPRAAADDAAADHPLVSSLKALRRLVFSPAAAGSPLLPAAALRPFLDAVRSEEANAAVTSASLAALHEVMALTWHALPGSALREVVDAVASCRFEAGAEADAEEAVLMRMLQALLACLRAPAAPALGDQHVCTAVNTCFRVVHQAAAKGELLQRFSRHAMHDLVRLVFARLPLIGGADAEDATVKPEPLEKEPLTCSPATPKPMAAPRRSGAVGAVVDQVRSSGRLAAKPTSGLSTLDKARLVLMKKSGAVLHDGPPNKDDLERYRKIYHKPLPAHFVKALEELVQVTKPSKAAGPPTAVGQSVAAAS